MARPEDSHILTALTSLLPRRRIRDLARQLGVVRRRRKLAIVAMVYALTLGFGTGERRTLSGLRRAYLNKCSADVAVARLGDGASACRVSARVECRHEPKIRR